ncbi:MAG: outer membrane lipid asymmetry maintenance protein MlaD [Gammaproteobacteria bacterium]|uniref:Outer membrane lipid asymmetry maintenance protein MlaD n=1 Tax=Candidatus Thiopontia autotrophica TaxID=2841688 RepID=A0A8J6PAI1_9GAMM|nr:outer membrane lipid asymmetry maintenance protein MlaD [Candidatus Thiopontia autotrophica]MBL6969518.1 outer membrane lipid asymmetry maintenance protein MlaD [Gammaproteobacteria bacterium]
MGLFAGLGIVALLVLAFYVGNLSSYNSDSGYRLEARFDEIGGLKVRAPVTMAGVQVGRVTDVYLDNLEYRAIVEMRIDPEKLSLQRVTESGEQILDKDGVPILVLCGDEPPEDSEAVLFPECATVLYEDAAASILTAGMLGEQYVGIEPGGGGATFLLPGDEIRMTQSSIALEQVIGQFLFNQVDKE